MKPRRKLGLVALVAVAVLALQAPAALAVPNLQVYIEGATWDPATETWVTVDSIFELWVIGANDVMEGVKFSAAVPLDESGTISVEWAKGGTGTLSPDLGYDPASDSTPVMGDGASLPPHGIFPTDFYQYSVGNFGLGETVEDKYPGETGTADGEVKKFNVTIDGYSSVHFDAYNHYWQNDTMHAKFSPPSHDAEAVPEPATLLLVGGGLLGLAGLRGRFRK